MITVSQPPVVLAPTGVELLPSGNAIMENKTVKISKTESDNQTLSSYSAI
jgi:hypothetical protein